MKIAKDIKFTVNLNAVEICYLLMKSSYKESAFIAYHVKHPHIQDLIQKSYVDITLLNVKNTCRLNLNNKNIIITESFKKGSYMHFNLIYNFMF